LCNVSGGRRNGIPPLTESKALPEEIPAFSLCIKDTGCELKQTLQIHPYIYGCQTVDKALLLQGFAIVGTAFLI